MKTGLPDNLLSQLSELVAARTALHFPMERWSDLERKARSAAKEFGFTDDEKFVQWLVSSSLTRDQMEILASHLTISETYFWREPQVFEALVERILPELVRLRENGDRRLRIWSAGCATGEEPYSIAIALRKAIPAIEDWRITILATDINPRILRKAMAGVYGEWSFRNAPPWLKEGYFHRKKDGRFEILPEIRKMVTFAYLNLAEDIYPSLLSNTNAMDIIFCRNVLMYFALERIKKVGQGFYRSLVDGGWLMVGSSELSQVAFPQFTPVRFPGAIVYRKETPESRPFASFPLEDIPIQQTMVLPSFEFAAGFEQVIPPPQFLASEQTRCLNPLSDIPAIMIQPVESHPVSDCSPQQDEETPRAMALSVRSLADRGKLADALATCEKAIAADKLDPGLHFLCATILQEQNMDSEAIASLKRALYLDPDFVLAHFALGNMELRKGKARAAKKCFENVLELLNSCGQDEILPESEGLTVGRFREIILATIQTGALA